MDFTLALPGPGSATAEQLSRDITDFLEDEDPDAGFRGRLNALLSAEQELGSSHCGEATLVDAVRVTLPTKDSENHIWMHQSFKGKHEERDPRYMV